MYNMETDRTELNDVARENPDKVKHMAAMWQDWSEFSDELASPGYYACKLNRYNTRAEVTTTIRTSICRFTFPKGTSNILLNTGLALTKTKGGTIRRVSDTEVEGSRIIEGFCGRNTIQTVYFVTRLSKQPASCGVWNHGRRFPEFKRETAGEVKDHMKRNIEIFSKGGGFVFNTVHNILPDVPPGNIMAMFEAIREFD